MSTETTVREYADTIIARARMLEGRSAIRRVVQREAKRYLGILAQEQQCAEKGITVAGPATIADLASACRDACEDAATWKMTDVGRTQLEGILRI